MNLQVSIARAQVFLKVHLVLLMSIAVEVGLLSGKRVTLNPKPLNP